MLQDAQLQAVLQAPKLTRTSQAVVLLQDVLPELPSTLLASFVGAAAVLTICLLSACHCRVWRSRPALLPEQDPGMAGTLACV